MPNPILSPEAAWQQPARQSPVAIAFILAKYLRRAVRSAWPLLIFLVVGKGEKRMAYFFGALVAVSLFQLLTALLAYFRFYFYIQADELIVEKGILARSRTSIPLERVQSLDFEQSFVHQLLGVVKVRVDTAGSSGSELALDAIDMGRAEALRAYILRRKEDLLPEPGPELETETPAAAPPLAVAAPDLMRLNLVDLLRVGLTQNHLRTAGILVGFLFTLLQVFDDIWDPEDYLALVEQVIGLDLTGWGWVMTVYTVVLLIVSFVATLVRTVLTYFDLRLQRLADGFKLTAGLFNRREQVARFRRLQWVRWTVNPLQARLGLHTVHLHQAGTAEKGRVRTISIPGTPATYLEGILAPYASAADRAGMTFAGISPRLVGRSVLWLGILPGLGLAAILFAQLGAWSGLVAGLWLLLVWLGARRYQRHYRWGWNGQLLHLHSRLIGQRDTLLWAYKLQSVRLSQGLYQRRKGLADLELHTASGDLTIPYLPLDMARSLRDALLYAVERSERDWM